MRFRALWLGALGAAALLAAGAYSLRYDSARPVQDQPIPGFETAGDLRHIALMGTSLSANGPWPDRLAERLTACLGHEVRLTRFARNGATAQWGLDQVDAVIAARPDLVLIEFAINDADITDGLSLADSRAAHAAMLQRLTEELPSARRALMTMSPAYGLKRLSRPRLVRYYDAYVTLAAEGGAGLIDLFARWVRLEDHATALPDGLHPSPERAAELILPVLVPAIARAAGQDCAVGS